MLIQAEIPKKTAKTSSKRLRRVVIVKVLLSMPFSAAVKMHEKLSALRGCESTEGREFQCLRSRKSDFVSHMTFRAGCADSEFFIDTFCSFKLET
jgi:hypothetical protein